MREPPAVSRRSHDRRADVIRNSRARVTKSPRSDMFRSDDAFAVNGRRVDVGYGGYGFPQSLRLAGAIKRAMPGSSHCDSGRFFF